jgi:hypothetical protein
LDRVKDIIDLGNLVSIEAHLVGFNEFVWKKALENLINTLNTVKPQC